MELSVVIPARNEERHLAEQLEALRTQPCDGSWEVIVVDNGSTDRTVDVVREFAARDPRFRVVEATERAGQNYAANSGVRAALADNVAFCDADDVVSQGWVAAMREGLLHHRVVTGPNEVDRLNEPWLALMRGNSGDQPVGTFHDIFPIVRGNNFAVRSEVWPITGPLIEGWRAVHDQEFSLRCWLNGIDVVGLNEAVVHYRYRSEPRDLWKQGFSYGRYRPRIARILKESGRGRAPRFAGWKSWLLLFAKLPRIAYPEGRATLAWIAGNRVGQLVGSVRERTVLL